MTDSDPFVPAAELPATPPPPPPMPPALVYPRLYPPPFEPPPTTGMPTWPAKGTRFTAMLWGVGTALWLVAFFAASSIVASLGAQGIRALGLEGAPATVAVVLVFLASYAADLGVVWLIARNHGFAMRPAVGFNRVSLGWAILLALGATIVSRVGGVAAALLMRALGLELPSVERTDQIFRLFGGGVPGLIAIGLVLCVMAPLAEEVFFRGVLFSALRERWGTTVGVLGSTLLFAALHLDPATVVVVFIAGAAFAIIDLWARSIWPSVIAHAMYNGIAYAAIVYLYYKGPLA